jgi:hypothetical protein
MMRGSTVPRKIDLEEKRVFVPTPMIQDSFFVLPVAALKASRPLIRVLVINDNDLWINNFFEKMRIG